LVLADNAGGILNRDAQIGLNTYWRDKRYDFTGDDLIYMGFNGVHKAETSDPAGAPTGDWAVWKFTYSTGDIVRIEGPITGAWDDRAAMAWA